MGAANGLYRLRPDGQTERYTTEQGLPANNVNELLVNRKGRLWVGAMGLCVISLAGSPRPSVERVYTAKDGLPNLSIRALIEGSDGKLWVGTHYGLCRITPDVTDGEPSVTVFNTSHGLSSAFVTALAEDRDGNLWVGTETLGVMKIARSGFITFGAADGLGKVRVASIFEDQAGRLCLFARRRNGKAILGI